MTMSASPLPSWGNGNASNPQSSMIRTWGVKVFVAITLMTVGSLWILSDGPFGQVNVKENHILRALSRQDPSAADYAAAISLMSRLDAIEAKLQSHERRFWLEHLEPTWHFRPKYWLGKATSVEDKDQIIPFFLANFVDANDKKIYPRRIYVDLGINHFASSVCFMMQHYPIKFDRIYGFECAQDMTDVPSLRAPIESCIAHAPAMPGKDSYETEEVIKTTKFHYNYIGLDDSTSTTPHTVGLNNFLLDTVREEDFVVVKMDVEGMEYDLLDRILGSNVKNLIDEIFVEIHYNHTEMRPWGWQNFKKSRAEATALFQTARDAGMFIHPWP